MRPSANYYFCFAAALALASCSPNTKKTAGADRVYYPALNDSIAMSIVLGKPIPADAQYQATYGSPYVWVWKAPNGDSLRGRYPKAELAGGATGSIPVYYGVGNSMKLDTLFRLDYDGFIPESAPVHGNLRSEGAVALFAKSSKGWWLKSNVFTAAPSGTSSPKAGPSDRPEDASATAPSERLVLIPWTKETNIDNDMRCYTQATRNLTLAGSRIMQVPEGQMWIPLKGESAPSANSRQTARIKIESDDEEPENDCYFGVLRPLSNLKRFDSQQVKEESRKYHSGTKIRFWGEYRVNAVMVLVIGAGPLPDNAVIRDQF